MVKKKTPPPPKPTPPPPPPHTHTHSPTHPPTHPYIHTVCHLGAKAGVRASIENPFLYIHTNISGTVLLMELSREFGIKNFVYASSSSVYGKTDNEEFSEDDKIGMFSTESTLCWLASYDSVVAILNFFFGEIVHSVW